LKRIVSTVALALLALFIVTLIIIGVFLDGIVKKAVDVYGPRMTQTSVTVDAVHLSLLTGSAKVKGLVVGNPRGYHTPRAIAVGTIAVGVDPATVFAKKVVIRSIRLEAPDVNFEGGLDGNNLSRILDNLSSTGGGSGTLSTNAAAQPKNAKTYEVDDFVITGAKVQVVLAGVREPQTISLPPIHLTGLGKGPEGVTAADLTWRALSALTSATLEAVARTAANFDKNAATLKQAGQNAGKEMMHNVVSNLLKQ
jgi:hypothetical protein